MFKVRKSQDRGYFDHGWLKTFHTFSFADYFDRHQMHFRNLRVINEDRVAPGRGFDMHPHQDMEIITYIISGALEHQDSMGNGAVIRPGEIQYMSAGTGVLHSEKNPSPVDECHLLQIWILPDRKGLPPRYDQRSLGAGNLVRLVAPESTDAGSDTIQIRAQTSVYAGKVSAGQKEMIRLTHGFGWLQVIQGTLVVNSVEKGQVAQEQVILTSGDGLAVSDESAVQIAAAEDDPVELLIFDLP